jgi:hypothetical protein
MESIRKRSHFVHPYLEGLKALNERKAMKIILECFAVDP